MQDARLPLNNRRGSKLQPSSTKLQKSSKSPAQRRDSTREANRAFQTSASITLHLSFDRNQVIRGWIDLDLHVLVFVKQAFVVHLPGDWASPACRGVFEIEDFDGFARHRLGDGHAGGSGRGIDENFDAAPFVRVELGVGQ